MITPTSTLDDVCFAVADALEKHGISGVLTGGSAAAVYAPQEYTSADADFVLDNEDPLSDVAMALHGIGFERVERSRMFSHPTCSFTVEFPAGPLAVGGSYVRETRVLERSGIRLRILTRTDCVRDRLNAAVAVAAQDVGDIDMALIRKWTLGESPALRPKLEEFESRLRDRCSQ